MVYGAVQQDIRRGANDPQIQIAEDTAAILDSGAPITSAVPPFRVDIARSLTPYIIVFDKSASPSAATAQLDGQIPKVSSGVFKYVTKYGQEWFTWEPKTGVREAVVLKKYSGGFVLAGRSIREVEKRELWIEMMVAGAWLFTLGTTFVATLFFEFLTQKKRK